MILEVADLQIKPDLEKDFEEAFYMASSIISSMHGYVSHSLKRCMEHKNKYLLLVWWETIEDHEIGFRQSIEYQQWKNLLHHFYDPFPTVLHYETRFSGLESRTN
jgi:heme-degrading monooxygenase HmoA